jgi:hypothetical protein
MPAIAFAPHHLRGKRGASVKLSLDSRRTAGFLFQQHVERNRLDFARPLPSAKATHFSPFKGEPQ